MKREVAAVLRVISAEYVRFKTGRHHIGHNGAFLRQLRAAVAR